MRTARCRRCTASGCVVIRLYGVRKESVGEWNSRGSTRTRSEYSPSPHVTGCSAGIFPLPSRDWLPRVDMDTHLP
eukprot:5180691-Pyramimonas_sp.AAC.1